MVEKYNIRTDLALEEKERFESDHVEVQGVILMEEHRMNYSVLRRVWKNIFHILWQKQ